VPFPYQVDQQLRRVWVTTSKTVVGRDIAETIEAIYLDDDVGAGFDVVWDGRNITSLLLEQDDTPAFVRIHEQYATASEWGRDVILVSRNLDFVMAGMYALQARPLSHKTYVVRSLREVERLLDQKQGATTTPLSISA
jgi:hypothetical protein